MGFRPAAAAAATLATATILIIVSLCFPVPVRADSFHAAESAEELAGKSHAF